MRYLRTLSVALLLAGCASGSGQAENAQPSPLPTTTPSTPPTITPITQTTDREWSVSAHYDGKRFYNTSGADKGAGDISTFLWQNLWNKEKWPKAIENPPADPIVERVTEGIRATYINHATVLVQVAGLNILTDVVKCLVMIDDIAQWGDFNGVYTQYFKTPYPARSAMGADGLALGASLELECIAVRR